MPFPEESGVALRTGSRNATDIPVEMLDQQGAVQQAVEEVNLRLLHRTRLTPVQGERGRYAALPEGHSCVPGAYAGFS